MIDLTQVSLEEILVHNVGNKVRDEGVFLSEECLRMDDKTHELLLKYFFKSMSTSRFFNLSHNAEIERNDVFEYVSRVFEDNSMLASNSKNLAKNLYEVSDHPKIKGGEFYVCLFKDCLYEDELIDAVGLFKTELKNSYLKTLFDHKSVSIGSEKGIDVNKLDKGCVIFNTEKENGYLVALIDRASSKEEAQYWKDKFLSLKPRNDSFNHTTYYLNKYKEFCSEEKNVEDSLVDKEREVHLLSRAVKYFDDNKEFALEKFKQEVINDESLVKAFEDKLSQDRSVNQDIPEEFEISDEAVKQKRKRFKSVLKLDKDFHVYIHGDESKLEKGFDEEKKLKFYKIYFKEES